MSVLTDGVLNQTVAWIQQDMSENGWKTLLSMGDEAMSQESGAGASQAIDYYNRSLQIHPGNAEVIYKLGLAMRRLEIRTRLMNISEKLL